MSLHGEIMNIPWQEDQLSLVRAERIAYKTGHRDARHAAAELALQQDAVVEKLVEALTLLVNDPGLDYIKSSSWVKASAALAAAREVGHG